MRKKQNFFQPPLLFPVRDGRAIFYNNFISSLRPLPVLSAVEGFESNVHVRFIKENVFLVRRSCSLVLHSFSEGGSEGGFRNGNPCREITINYEQRTKNN